MKTLKLFNSVIKDNEEGSYAILPEYGVIIEPNAFSQTKEIKKFLKEKLLNGEQLNQSFHKSWEVISKSSREELFLHQILHYMTTYGTGHSSKFVYTPNEELDIPEMEFEFLVIRGLSKEELVGKCLDLLESGVALKEETIKDISDVLRECDYSFTGEEIIKNKEALMYFCKETRTMPQDPVEMLRYFVFLTINKTLLIKNKNTYKNIEGVKIKYHNVVNEFKKADEEKLATIFNRFKPIFLSLKKIMDEEGKAKINRISKLSKSKHIPMSYNILNNIGTCSLEELEKQKDNITKNSNFFQLARCLNFLKISENATCKIYNIRNGKSFAKEVTTIKDKSQIKNKINFILDVMKNKFDLSGTNIYIPEYTKYALPTSEKNFVGNIPMGTKFLSDNNIAYGVYWKNEGGARDIDLSALSSNGKVGWNAHYHDGELAYSGDMTTANPCAVEYLSTAGKLDETYLVMANIYSGMSKGSKMKIVLGNSPELDKKHMMNPNDVWVTSDTESLDKSSILGIIYKENNKYCSVVMNRAIGSNSVSYNDKKSMNVRTALVEQYKNSFSLNDVVKHCGGTLTKSVENADIDLTPSKLEKDSIIGLFK